MISRFMRALGAASLAAMVGLAPAALAAEPIRLAYVDPLSGTFAQQGDASLKMFSYVLSRLNARGGALGRTFELVPYDSKLQPAEALIALKSITDQNISFLMHCAGSNVAAALIDGVAKHLDIKFYTYLAHVVGAVTAVGPTAENRLHSVMEFHPNVPGEGKNAEAEAFVAEWRKMHDFDLFQANVVTMLDMLAAAITKAGGIDPYKVALALEDIRMNDLMGNENIMRKEDHQMVEPFYVARLVRNARYDTEKTGLGWQTQLRANASELMQPTTCKMKRPTQ